MHSYVEAAITSDLRFELAVRSLSKLKATIRKKRFGSVQKAFICITAVLEAAYCSRNSSVSQADQPQLDFQVNNVNTTDT